VSLDLVLRNPSKERILEIYRKTQNLGEMPGKEGAVSGIMSLKKVEWALDHHVRINLTPSDLEIRYSDERGEPDYVSRLKRELSSRNPDTITFVRQKISNPRAE
jgi:hypothetical protein